MSYRGIWGVEGHSGGGDPVQSIEESDDESQPHRRRRATTLASTKKGRIGCASVVIIRESVVSFDFVFHVAKNGGVRLN